MPAVRRALQIQAVRRKADVIELDFIEAPRDKFFCDGDVVFPYFFGIGIDPVFIVIRRRLSRSRIGSGIIRLNADPRTFRRGIPYRVLAARILGEVPVFKHDDARDEVYLILFKLGDEVIDVDGVLRYAPFLRHERIARLVAQKTVIVFHIDDERVQIIIIY